MQIQHIVATKVYGYLEFNINFDKKLNLLVGGNGSGKTTILSLMNALLTPNFKTLLTIPFERIELVLLNNKEEITIVCNSDEDNISLTISSQPDHTLTIQKYSINEIELYPAKNEGFNELIQEINREHGNHPVIKCITEIYSPVYLGIDRKDENFSSHKIDDLYARERWLHTSSKRSVRARRLIKGSLGASLMDIQFLVQETYRRFKEIEDRQAERLRDSILLSSFTYIGFNHEESKVGSYKERSSLLDRAPEIKEAISNITSNSRRLNTEVDIFFNKLSDLFKSMSEMDDDGLHIEWLTNKAQVDRILGIVEVLDEYKSKTDSIFEPIDQFLNTVNKFYSESGKSLTIDKVGRLSVIKPDKKSCSIEGLSSGERQLLIIFAHVLLNKYKHDKEIVFIIDEPELSLHLGWQEMFSEMLNDINSSVQFILATHSPDIVGSHKNKAINVSKKGGIKQLSTKIDKSTPNKSVRKKVAPKKVSPKKVAPK